MTNDSVKTIKAETSDGFKIRLYVKILQNVLIDWYYNIAQLKQGVQIIWMIF